MEGQGGSVRRIAANATGELHLCPEDRAALNLLVRGVKWLVFESIKREAPNIQADELDRRMRAIFVGE